MSQNYSLDNLKQFASFERNNISVLKESQNIGLNQSYMAEIQKLRCQLDEAQHQAYVAEVENKNNKGEVFRLQNMLKNQEREFNEELTHKLESLQSRLTNTHNQEIDKLQYELDQTKIKLRQVENNVFITNSHKNRLEEALSASNNQIKQLTQENEYSKSQISNLETENSLLKEQYESLWRENEAFRQKTLEQNAQRENMIKLIEEKMKEIESDRVKLINEKDMLNTVINDLTTNINRHNQVSNENNQAISSLQLQLAEEINKNKRLDIDLDTAKEEIVLLELKNNEIFENLQKELSVRAKEYKERALTLLNTPSKSVYRAQEEAYNSPYKESVKFSPIKEKSFLENTMPSIELIGKTPKRDVNLTRVQQERVHSAAIKILQRPESPLKNIRISSPSRRSPERPSPYTKKFLRGTPDNRSRSTYVV